ncbi:MAG: AbrB family transcriptional regulator [Candidatus Bathyarchaeia archaeon]|nr:AbrB family transcriptional regulator [Candidatus Bathyarchaeota archaeon]
MNVGVEVRKVDSQGRVILPSDWRKSEVNENGEVYIVSRRGYLKIIPKRRPNLAEYFDSVDLGVDAIGDWKEFERKLREETI